MKIDKAVRDETLFLSLTEGIMTALMIAVFLIIGKFDIYVLFGGLTGAVVSVLNFFLMGLTLQKCLDDADEKHRNSFLSLSKSARMIGIVVVVVVAVAVFDFNIYATLIPLVFPRISMLIRQITMKKEDGNGENEK